MLGGRFFRGHSVDFITGIVLLLLKSSCWRPRPQRLLSGSRPHS